MRPQLNPFYIEDAESTWEGDWRYDDYDVEEEGLLEMTPRHLDEQEQLPTSRRREAVRSLRRPQNLSHHRFLKPRPCMLFGIVFVIFVLLLSLMSDSERSHGGDVDNKTDASSVTAAPVHSIVFAPTILPTVSPVANASGNEQTFAPTSMPTSKAPTSEPTKSPTFQSTFAPTSPRSTPTPNVAVTPLPTNTTIVILGERNSGVKWLKQELGACFPSVDVHDYLSRGAFWFQDPPTDDRGVSLLLVLAVRNPLDWIFQMYQNPYFMPVHNETETIEAFVNTRWTMPDENDNKNEPCQLGFHADQVVPCHPANDVNFVERPLYELDPSSGNPFETIAALRSAKVKHWLHDIPANWAQQLRNDNSLIIHHYEDSLFAATIPSIERSSRWQNRCIEDSKAPSGAFPSDDELSFLKNWTKDAINWTLEEQIGYSQ